MARGVLFGVLLSLLGFGVAPAEAQFCFTDCENVCNPTSLCTQSCTASCNQSSSCGQYGVCDPDPDDDGWISPDNCPVTYNPDQANCDGDSGGDACDSFNASYQPVGATRECHIVGRTHVGYFDVSLHTERPIRDTSLCGAPDGWAHNSGPQFSCAWSPTMRSQLACCDRWFGPVRCTQFLNNDRCQPAILNF
jgi:hypothetical protein